MKIKKVILVMAMVLSINTMAFASSEINENLRNQWYSWYESLNDNQKKDADAKAFKDDMKISDKDFEVVNEEYKAWQEWYESLSDEDKDKLNENTTASINPKTGVITSGIIITGMTAAALYGASRKY